MINDALICEEPSSQGGRMIRNTVGSAFVKASRTHNDVLSKYDALIESVVDLFLRISTTDQAELYATVHKSASDLSSVNRIEITSEKAVFEDVLIWKRKHKPPIDETKLATAIRDLNVLGWVHLQPSQELPIYDC